MAGTQDRVLKIALGQSTARNLGAFLRTGQTDIQGLLTWIQKNPSPITPATTPCRDSIGDYTCFFTRTVPAMHAVLRQLTAVVMAPQMGGFNDGDLRVAGNPFLLEPVGGPFQGSLEALDPAELAQIQKEWLTIWDGQGLSSEEIENIEFLLDDQKAIQNKGLIQEYIELLQQKIVSAINNPALQDQLQAKLSEFKNTRKFKTPADRVRAAMLIFDPSWTSFRNNQLHRARLNVMESIWNITNQFRFLVYLPKRKITLSDIRQALQHSLDDNLTLQTRVQSAHDAVAFYGPLSPSRSRGTGNDMKTRRAQRELQWLMQFPQFVELSVSQNPELAQTAQNILAERQRTEALKDKILLTATLAPFLLLFSPAAVALGTVGAATLMGGAIVAGTWASAQSISRYQSAYELYMAHWTSTKGEQLISRQEIQSAHRDALVSPTVLVLVLGLPMLKGGFKSLWTAPNP
ncbi:MAG: hypothetical protein AB7N80_14620 [Bdellovibrionales bacterium]